jgi:peptidoglycan/LPS O-acetylase OafA/YrhL
VPQGHTRLKPNPEQHAPSADLVPGLPPPENRRFFPGLDGLRAVAVILVFLQHYPTEKIHISWGWTGVDLFFVLSGFLITGILYDTRDAAHRVRNFYARRALRIFPLYYTVLLIALGLYPLFHWILHPGLILLPVYLANYSRFLFLHDYLGPHALAVENLYATHVAALFAHPSNHPVALYFSHFWSLCVEEQFYLVWPWIVFAVRNRIRLRNLCAAVFALGLALRLICAFTLPQTLLHADLLYRATPFRIDALLLGGLLALALRGPERLWIQEAGGRLMGSTAVVFLLLELASHITQHHLLSLESTAPWMSTLGFSLVDLFCAGVILIAIQPRTVLSRVMQLPWLRKLGQMSYGFYILHYPPQILYLWVTRHYFQPHLRHVGPAYLLLAFASTVLLAWLSFRFFETPFLRLKATFAD